ncbi:MAG: NAD(P)H-binding protein [Solirubrobacterales bacterium]
MSRVLIAGASGHLGRQMIGELSSRGYETRALIRNERKRELVAGADETIVLDLLEANGRLERALEGVDVVFSAAGQPCTLQSCADRKSFCDIDYPINRNLLGAALRHGVQKFAYVTVLAPPHMREDPYVEAHERFVEELTSSGIEYAVIRANGFFYSYLDLLDVARRGLAVSFSDGKARSNPIHEADLAIACVEAIESEGRESEVGGPEVITRREEIDMAFAAVSRKPRVLRIPRPLLWAGLAPFHLRDRRRAEMVEFLARLSNTDVLGERHGKRRLADYLRERA